MCGLPTIIAAISRPEHSHGFIERIPFGNVGEEIPGMPLRGIFDLLRDYSSANAAERVSYSARARDAVAAYSVAGFVDALQSAAIGAGGRQPSWADAMRARLFYAVTEGVVRRHFLGRGIKRRVRRLFGLR